MPRKFDFISPGIEITEVDQSILPADVDAEGPIIIGRTSKGPALKPVKIRSLEDYITIFGNPNPGGDAPSGDLWRDGAGAAAPEYASFAAQSWLAGGTSPVTMVRLLGKQHENVTTGYAGWKLSGSVPDAGAGDNSTAYGLFIIPSSSANNDQTGGLAAVFYCDTGNLRLKGKVAGGSTDATAESTLVVSDADNIGFTLVSRNSSGSDEDTISFNFSRTSGNYIRKKFSTNPTLINSSVTKTANQKNYWLGESYERFANSLFASNAAKASGKVFGALIPLHKNDEATNIGNWGYRRQSYAAPESGWVISQDFGATGSYSETTANKMFRVVSLHEGEAIQKEVFISFESLTLPPNPDIYAYSTFDLVVRSIKSGNSLERFSGCNMDPNSQNYVARRIGDMYHEWDYSEKRWKSYGDYVNNSSYIRVLIADSLPEQKDSIPFGFLGPARPKSFGIASGSAGPKDSANSDTFSGAFVKKSRTISENFVQHDISGFSGSFDFPKISLREAGTDGFAANPYKAMYGIRPKIDSKSNLHDYDYCDYVRSLPSTYKANNFAPTGDFEHSFVFSLDNLVITTGSNIVNYTVGARANGNSYTGTNDVESLLSLGVGQWAMPLFGGFDGLDVTEIEPFRRGLTSDTDTDITNYLQNSLSIAIESVSDEEQVPANLLLAPGLVDSHITQRLVSVADSRKDCLALIDLATGDYLPKAERITTDNENSDAVRGKVSTAVTDLKTRQLDSSYAAAFYPWVQIRNTLGNNELVWIPPSIAALGALAKTDSTSELWFAPAGFNRGGLDSLGGRSGPVVVQARQKLDSRDRDDLYKVNINPIASFPNEGLVIFGQKTLQQANSALDRINVRRLMIFLKKEISDVAKGTLFQNNVPATWDSFKGRAEPILSSVKNRFGLSDYRLVLDETTTTPDLIDRNIMYVKVFLKPARAIEYIAIDFVITKTGADFV